MTTIHLDKLHATGNDFLVLAALPGTPEAEIAVTPGLAAALCDRHRGVGADGLLVLGPADPATGDGADCTMLLLNADGGPAEMSGNGIRCLAAVAAARGLARGDDLGVATAAGLRPVVLERGATGEVTAAEVGMGAPTFDPAAIPLAAESAFDVRATFHGVDYAGDAVGLGNPHWVLFVDDPDAARVTQHGPRLEHDPRFPQRTNVEFVAVDGAERLRLRVWERGAGETLSCGTGACAAVAAAQRRGLAAERVTVAVPGGELGVSQTADGALRLAGPVARVFGVDVDPERLAPSLRAAVAEVAS